MGEYKVDKELLVSLLDKFIDFVNVQGRERLVTVRGADKVVGRLLHRKVPGLVESKERIVSVDNVRVGGNDELAVDRLCRLFVNDVAEPVPNLNDFTPAISGYFGGLVFASCVNKDHFSAPAEKRLKTFK